MRLPPRALSLRQPRPGFAPEVLAGIATLTNASKPSGGWQRKIDRYLRGLRAAGILPRLDVLSIFTGENSAQGLVNYALPASPLTSTSSPGGGTATWAAAGFASDGVATLLTTGRTTLASSLMTRNDHCAFIWTVTDIAQDKAAYGNEVFAINPRSLANEIRVRSCTSTADVQAVTSARGLTMINRTNSANFDIWKDGVKLATKARATVLNVASNDWFCAWNNTGGSNQWSTNTIGVGGRGASLTDAQAVILSTLTAELLRETAATPLPYGLWAGNLDATSFDVKFDSVTPATDAQIVASTASDFASIAASTTAAPTTVVGSYNIGSHSLTGLTAATDYYVAPKINNVIQTASAIRIRTAPTKWARAAFDVALMSCFRTTQSVQTLTHDKIAEQRPHIAFMVGDAGYADTTFGTETSLSGDVWGGFHRQHRDNISVKLMLAGTPLEQVYDDHDYWGGNNNSADTSGQLAGGIVSRAALNAIMPHWQFAQTALGEADTTKLMATRWGDIATTRFVILDTRAQRSRTNNTILGNSTYKPLGFDQKGWLFNTFIPAVIADKALGRIDNLILISPTGVPGIYDGWADYAAWQTEFTEITTALKQAGMPRVDIWTGDDHNSMFDKNNQIPGIRIIRSSPVVNNSDLDGSAHGMWDGVDTSVFYNHRMFVRARFDASAGITYEMWGKQDIAVTSSPIVLLRTVTG